MEFFASAGNIPVHIRDSKKGQNTIILLHGYLETMYVWNELYDELSKQSRVIAIDLPGHGLSCSAPINTMDFMATVVKGVLDVCGVSKAAIISHSLGGYVAMSCGKLFPETFSHIVFLNSHPYKDSEEKIQNSQREISLIRSGKLMILADLSIPKMYHPSNLRNCDEKILQTVELCETHDPEGIVSCINGSCQREDNSQFINTTKIPLLFIAGDSDNLVNAAIISRMQKDFHSLNLKIIPSTGHNSFIENQQATLSHINQFITLP